jgi:DNA-binding CsgD family transcriptional regulator
VFPVADAGRDPLTGKIIPHERNDKTAGQVEAMAALGFSEKDIAVALNLRPGQVKQHYSRELEVAAVKANSQVARAFFDAAKSGKNWQASLAWLKARAGWDDGQQQGGGISIQINL